MSSQGPLGICPSLIGALWNSSLTPKHSALHKHFKNWIISRCTPPRKVCIWNLARVQIFCGWTSGGKSTCAGVFTMLGTQPLSQNEGRRPPDTHTVLPRVVLRESSDCYWEKRCHLVQALPESSCGELFAPDLAIKIFKGKSHAPYTLTFLTTHSKVLAHRLSSNICLTSTYLLIVPYFKPGYPPIFLQRHPTN